MADAPPIPPSTFAPPPSFSLALTNSLQKATERLNDGQLIYGPAAEHWDAFLLSDTVRKLPARLRNPLKALCKDISTLAQQHFDAYLTGAPLPKSNGTLLAGTSPPATRTPSSASASNTPPPTNLSPNISTYAEAVAATPPPQNTTTLVRKPRSAKHTPIREDTRLFLRLKEDHPARAAGTFAVLTILKQLLRADAHLIKEVQETKTGFALCTSSAESLTALEAYTARMETIVTNCRIERQQQWTTYRMDFVPRTVRVLDNNSVVQNTTVTSRILSEAICSDTRQEPVRAIETVQSTSSGLFNTSWFVSFKTSTHSPIPKVLRILGTTVSAHPMVPKPKVIQCTRCYHWHNARSCTRPPRCRLCGSHSHSEVNHTTNCGTENPHSCPARCTHCGGPHPADDILCPLRPSQKQSLNKAQRLMIIQTSKLSRTKACATANCTRKAVADTRMEDPEPIPTTPKPTTPTTPIQRATDGPPATPTAPRFTDVSVNPFAPLSFNA